MRRVVVLTMAVSTQNIALSNFGLQCFLRLLLRVKVRNVEKLRCGVTVMKFQTSDMIFPALDTFQSRLIFIKPSFDPLRSLLGHITSLTSLGVLCFSVRQLITSTVILPPLFEVFKWHFAPL
mgnify:FL=1